MTYFLQRIAQHLYDQTGGNLRNHCIVFPNRRAGIYFIKYLSSYVERPVWTPSIMTVREFFGSMSALRLAENEILLCRLYEVYREINPKAESFDDFYFWGDMLISDFDDTDKYLADAPALFRNVADIKDIESRFGDLEPDKIEIIRQFWVNFKSGKPTPEKEGFVSVWSVMTGLYHEFRNILRAEGIAYEGMIFRDVVSAVLAGDIRSREWEQVHFVGFNALNRCEEAVMHYLQDEGKGRFYWDYDNSYLKAGRLNSAGLFLRRNLTEFRNDMPGDWNYDTMLSAGEGQVRVKVLETASDIAQVKLIPGLISQIPDLAPGNAHHTAVVLADEELLVPVLTSLPENMGDINVSMGFPLKMSGVYTLVRSILDFQKNAETDDKFLNRKDVSDILKHDLIRTLLTEEEEGISESVLKNYPVRVPYSLLTGTETLKFTFRRDSGYRQLSDHLKDLMIMVTSSHYDNGNSTGDSQMQERIRNEFIYRVILCLNRLESVLSTAGFEVKKNTYIRILERLLRSQSVPFSGEPLTGIQVMGILETRALDFENLIILSVNEGVLPAVTSGSSFIPFSIREAFGLPTINHQESIFAYHFYRLLHRAKKITLVYNSNPEGLRTGEMSRFILQMKYERIGIPEFLTPGFDIRTPSSISHQVGRRPEHNESLSKAFEEGKGKSLLSPTAINTWLNCRMRFYYRYVCQLKEPVKPVKSTDHAALGQVLHRLMKEIYNDFTGKEVRQVYIDSVISHNKDLEERIGLAFREEYKLGEGWDPDGNELIIRDILKIYLLRILKRDRAIAPFTVLGLEQPVISGFTFEPDEGSRKLSVRIGGNADRIDKLEGRIRIVDYKTGDVGQRISSIEDLFEEDRSREGDAWLQTLLYCEALLRSGPKDVLMPTVYRIRSLSDGTDPGTLVVGSGRGDELIVDDYSHVRDEFMTGLTRVISAIFSRVEPFVMTGDLRKCGYCPYRGLCLRG